MCPSMDGLHSDAVLTCSTALHSHHAAAADLDTAVRSVNRLGDYFQRSPAAWCSGVSTVVGDDARLLPAVTDPESARWSSAETPVWGQFGSRPETRSSGKLGTEQMDWQVKGPMGDSQVLQGGSDVPRRTHENDQHQWAVQNDGVLYSGSGTTQKGYHLPTPSSSRTTGSLDSASSTGFAASAANCTNGLLLGPDTIQDPGKVCNDWLFADIKDEKSSYRLSSANGGTEYASPKASVINESRCSSAAANKRTSCEEAADPHQVGVSKGTGGSVSKVSSARPAKKHRIVAPGLPRCQVEGCRRDLTDAKEYHRRHKVCEDHAKAPKIIADGIEQRFCQQCSRFHALGEFDDAKKSCRKRLAGHNERRRKSCQDAPALSVVSMLQDGGRHLDRSFFMHHPMALPLSVYQNGDTTRAWSRALELQNPVAIACRGAQLLSGERQSVPPPYTEADRQLTILQARKGVARPPLLKYVQGSSLAESLPMVASSSSQGPSVLAGLMEAAASSVATPPGSHPGLLDSGRALSLLSSQALVGKPLDENGAPPPLQQLPIEHSSVSQSTFPTLTDNPQKILTLPSSPKTIGLSMCTSASVSETQVQHKSPLMSNLQAAYSDALLAQLLQKNEFRSLGGASSNHAAKPTLDLMNFKSHTNHGQFASSHDMQAGSAQLVQHLQSIRDSDGSSVLNVHTKIM